MKSGCRSSSRSCRLRKKLSKGTVDKLRHFVETSPEDLHELRVYEQDICVHFLPMPHLGARFRGLKLLHDLALERADLERAIGVARAAYEAALADAASSQICDVVGTFLTLWARVTRQKNLAGLASVGRTQLGKRTYERFWRREDPLHAKQAVAQGFLAALEHAMSKAEARSSAEFQAAVERVQKLKMDARAQTLTASAVDDACLTDAAVCICGMVAIVESELASAIKVGRNLLEGLGALPAELPTAAAEDSGCQGELCLARELDQCVRHFREVMASLREAQREVQSDAQKRAAPAPALPVPAQRSGKRRCLGRKHALPAARRRSEGFVVRSPASAVLHAVYATVARLSEERSQDAVSCTVEDVYLDCDEVMDTDDPH
mmetsp:Transcript_55764/g.158198  ORF Transcript_55764/g.158198 Transcript_55764/m.158198 type:complete len:378 (+) Transcript_55764:1791-2924(+)